MSANILEQGLHFHLAGNLARAEEIYRAFLAGNPRHGDALNLLGSLALQTGRHEESVALLEQAVAAEPHVASYLANLGAAYLSSDRSREALEVLTRGLKLNPSLLDANYNLAVANYNLGRLEIAYHCYQKSLHYQPEDARTNNNLGNLCLELGRTEEALMHLDIALKLQPDLATAHYNRGLALLRLGRFREGWPEYEWRFRTSEASPPRFKQPVWDGRPAPAKKLLVHAEQGLGDTIQLVRYMPLLHTQFTRVFLEVQASLISLLTQSGFAELVPQRGELPPFDVQISLPSLPGALDTTADTIPANIPYLSAKPELIEHWRKRSEPYTGQRVGIAWQGSPTYREDRFRSIPLACFAPLAQIPGVQLFSLQKGFGAEQMQALPAEFPLVDLMQDADTEAGPFMDTCAILKNLDLVITSDTSIAHLAGALGVPVWVALRSGPDWRWLTDRSDSPWYPTMRLFRQPQFGDWMSVFTTIGEELRKRGQVSEVGGQGTKI